MNLERVYTTGPLIHHSPLGKSFLSLSFSVYTVPGVRRAAHRVCRARPRIGRGSLLRRHRTHAHTRARAPARPHARFGQSDTRVSPVRPSPFRTPREKMYGPAAADQDRLC